jgi:hypothetical protein
MRNTKTTLRRTIAAGGMPPKAARCLALCAVLLAWTSPTMGARLRVPSAGFPTIQAAIDAAQDGDTIVVRNGTYTGDGNRDIDFKGKTITIRSESGARSCIIDCQGTATQPHQGFLLGGSGGTITGFTIENGYSDAGGGICISNSRVTVTDCILRHNTGVLHGGGAYVTYWCSAEFLNCTFEENKGGSFAGGLSGFFHASAKVANCRFKGNTGGDGGAISTLDWCNFLVIDCVFTANSAGKGAGVTDFLSSSTLINCLFAENDALYGGAIVSAGAGAMPTILNCTIVNNTGGDRGGGIFCFAWARCAVANCILWGNRDSSGTGESAQIVSIDELAATVSYSCVEDADAGDTTVYPGTGNIDDDPRFLAFDCQLGPQSPCVNAGDNSSVPSWLTTDLNGRPRIQAGTVDMGAYESPFRVMTNH